MTDSFLHPEPPPVPDSPPGPRETRKRLPTWERVKFTLLLALLWLALVWASMADNPLLPFRDAAREQLRSGRWVFVLLGVEILRQIHFLISEHWSAYHRFWTHSVFGGMNRMARTRMSDWTRYRIRRMLIWVFWIIVFAVVAGKALGTSPILGLFQAPALLWKLMPFVLQLAFAFFFIAFQFIGMFWLLSRGGVDVYFPDDIKTRFSDVWGQDHVVARVKANILL